MLGMTYKESGRGRRHKSAVPKMWDNGYSGNGKTVSQRQLQQRHSPETKEIRDNVDGGFGQARWNICNVESMGRGRGAGTIKTEAVDTQY